jgi:hypothetical protein
MATGFEDVRVLQAAERVADEIWNSVIEWDEFARDVVGKQLARAADSMAVDPDQPLFTEDDLSFIQSPPPEP